MEAAMAVAVEPEEGADQKRMSFWDHLDELRRRLKITFLVVIVLFVLFLTTGIGQIAVGSTQIPVLLPALGPTSSNVATEFFLAVKAYLVPDRVGGLPLNFSYQQPWDAYIVMFKVAFFLAIVVGSPFIFYEVGQFIGPALRPTEKRLIVRMTLPVLLLFIAGVTMCFVLVLPFTFNLLFSVQNLMGANFLVLYGDNFIDFVLLFSLAFGVAFQLPVIMYGLSAVGIVTADFWRRHWRIAAAGIFLFGAIITPDGSGVTMMLVSLPMLVLYVVGYGFSRRASRRRSAAAKSS
jgi:sec-independent protein translocase protein TatC